jgi:hypothetical protein
VVESGFDLFYLGGLLPIFTGLYPIDFAALFRLPLFALDPRLGNL